MERGGPAGFPGAPGSPDRPAAAANGATNAANEAVPPDPAGRQGGARGRTRPLGGSIHEVGTARMSASSKDGVLNPFCQTHDIENLYVFGGNAFVTTGDKHPTLTMMALSARGCDHLLEKAKGKKV
jgi:choline dehydrogenase-like flavoprotein